jgi:hypothetical protein
MKKGQKSYFLTVDKRRSLRSDGITRPGRHQRKEHQVERLVKEPTTVLSIRVAASAATRFKNFVYGLSLAEEMEEAMVFYIVHRGLEADEVRICCSEAAYQNNSALLKQFRRRRKRGGLSRTSVAYDVGSTRIPELKNAWIVTIPLPPARSSQLQKRIDLLSQVIKAADVSVDFGEKSGLSVFKL